MVVDDSSSDERVPLSRGGWGAHPRASNQRRRDDLSDSDSDTDESTSPSSDAFASDSSESEDDISSFTTTDSE